MADNKTSDIGTAVNAHCIVRIKGRQIVTSNIIQLVIREWIFDVVPRLELLINDDGIFTEVFPIKDGDKIYVELAKNDTGTPLRMEFDILGWYSGSMMGNKFNQIQFVGLMSCQGLYYPTRTRCFSGQNSYEVFSEIASEASKKLNKPPELSPNDLMNWIQSGLTNLEMCKHVIKRSHVQDDTPFFYGDTKGEFNYTSLKTELSKKVNTKAWFDIEKYSSESFEDDADYNNLWFSSFNIYDYSSIANKTKNYGIDFSYYDVSRGTQVVDIASSESTLAKMPMKSTDGSGEIVGGHEFGHLPTNVHEKYYHGVAQNEYFRSNFFNGYLLELDINALGKPNLFDLVFVAVPSMVGDGYNSVLSGNYVIGGIIHEYSAGEQYHKKTELFRNGINKSEFETENVLNTAENAAFV